MTSPGEHIREELKRRGWGQADLALIMGRPVQRISELVLGKTSVSPEVAIELAAALGGTAETWLNREAAYRLSLADATATDVKIKSRLYELGPVKEMQKRGWIKETDSVKELEAELIRFYGLSDIGDRPRAVGVMRKTAPETELTPAQQAWVFRIRNVAAKMPAVRYDESRIDECRDALRKLAAYSAHAAKVPKVLNAFGIRFVVAEPLSGGKIDGVTTWLAEDAPVIGLSMRFERIDNFWHTLLHEVIHVRHKDESIDLDMGEDVTTNAKPAFEKRADEEAASCLVPRQELTGFIRRYGPLYSASVINQLANKLKVHPGIIVGQLHHLGEIGYSKFRDLLVKVRDTVTAAAVTDGWGHKIDQRIFS
jgi:HTH-type transcriptional regulator / antitoxin HigA